MNKLETYYNKFNEEKRLDSRHGQIEFRVTMHYIQDALKRLMKEQGYDSKEKLQILDIGAATGRYSVPLCEEGYSVTALEPVKYNLGILKQKNSQVNAMQGNALRLKKLADETFDLTLVFGPMYHLLTKEERLQALREARRVTKKDGIILIAYVMNEYAFVMYAVAENKLRECLEQGKLDETFHTIPGEDDLYAYLRLEDIDALNEESGLRREKILSPDGPANYIRMFMNRLSEEDFEEVVKYQLCNCERPELIGAGAHTVDIVRKVESSVWKQEP